MTCSRPIFSTTASGCGCSIGNTPASTRRCSISAGCASNSELSAELSDALLEGYFGRPLDDELRLKATAMTAASLLRETLWAMVSEVHSTLAFDYAAYTAENLARFEAAYANNSKSGPNHE